MMHPQVFISGLLLLLPGAVDCYTVVKAVLGRPVTLPCTYPTLRGVSTTCWGRGQCPSFNCVNTLIWTNGHRVTYQRNNRYQLKGNISGGNVSLTIENVVQSDSGLYCCRVEVPGWFNDLKVTFSLEVKPEIPTSPPTITTTERVTTTVKPTTISTRPTHVPTSPRVSTSTPTTPTQTQTHTPDWNNTMTSSDDSWNNYTESIPSWNRQKNMTKGFYVGISIAALLLLLVCTVVITRSILLKKKSGSLSLVAYRVSKIGALESIASMQSRVEDNVYIIEDPVLTLKNQSQEHSEGPSS
ncbi:hepatitis A virus cellular receptor 1 homolog isoform X2 [Mesocricetus auratus]|uniref:Hepatitis A virus cellular receptor 1 homolog isoform X2 n=1 Tax=Mesocricetus auratus TaxID=10036 RepID=A0ABM2XQP3_MESAU|nr:hepatitis A virus cellular receptor 1 homolog isoform X2 [Mesocricetus auratus]